MPKCHEYLSCFSAQQCNPADPCGQLSGVWGWNTLGGGLAPQTMRPSPRSRLRVRRDGLPDHLVIVGSVMSKHCESGATHLITLYQNWGTWKTWLADLP